MPIITSLCDTDFYKLSMMQVVYHHFPGISAQFEFKSRNYPGKLYKPYLSYIEHEINALGKLRFKDVELGLLQNEGCFKSDFLDFLEYFRLNPEDKVRVEYDDKKNEFAIIIAGSWLDTILFEVPILAIVSELICPALTTSSGKIRPKEYMKEGDKRFNTKVGVLSRAKHLRGDFVKFTDFGTRRRFSKEWHEHVVERCVDELTKEGSGGAFDNFIGTSNIALAMKYKVPMVGTMAHEFIQAGQGLVHPRDSQRFMLGKWLEEYRGVLGIALTDTLGFKAFLNDFDGALANAYTGCRQDSGDPVHWTEELLAHYINLGIAPETKTAVYSDGLTFERMVEIESIFRGRINMRFGIGTNLTNDVGIIAPQIVIKMTRCNGRPVAKISDSHGKGMCKDEVYLAYLKNAFGIKDGSK